MQSWVCIGLFLKEQAPWLSCDVSYRLVIPRSSKEEIPCLSSEGCCGRSASETEPCGCTVSGQTCRSTDRGRPVLLPDPESTGFPAQEVSSHHRDPERLHKAAT